MTYHTKDYENYLEKIKKIRQLDWVQNHLNLMAKPNFWSILEYGEKSISAYETRISRMFRWLMDANGTHGLGNIFAHKLLQLVGIDYIYSPDKNEAIHATNEEKHIDVLYKDYSQKVIVAIEVKQYAEEHGNQLNNYEKEVLAMTGNKDGAIKIDPHFIYLTPLKDDPSNKKWHPVGYEEFIKIIDEVYDEYMTDSTVIYIEDTKKIISDFKDDLQRSIDLAASKGNRNDIIGDLKEKETELTKKLVHEIQHETDMKHLNKLMEMNTDKDLELKALILIVDSYIAVQNKEENIGVQILIRKIYNYFSEYQNLETNPGEIKKYKVNETLEALKQEVIEKYELPYNKIVITKDKGQGLYLYHRDHEYRVYLSGDTYGNFPNDGIQLLPYGNKEKKGKKFPTINHERFQVDDQLILEDKVKTKDGKIMSLDQLIEDYIIVELKRLSNYIAEEINV